MATGTLSLALYTEEIIQKAVVYLQTEKTLLLIENAGPHRVNKIMPKMYLVLLEGV
jgi:hypothetical protein